MTNRIQYEQPLSARLTYRAARRVRASLREARIRNKKLRHLQATARHALSADSNNGTTNNEDVERLLQFPEVDQNPEKSYYIPR